MIMYSSHRDIATCLMKSKRWINLSFSYSSRAHLHAPTHTHTLLYCRCFHHQRLKMLYCVLFKCCRCCCSSMLLLAVYSPMQLCKWMCVCVCKCFFSPISKPDDVAAHLHWQSSYNVHVHISHVSTFYAFEMDTHRNIIKKNERTNEPARKEIKKRNIHIAVAVADAAALFPLHWTFSIYGLERHIHTATWRIAPFRTVLDLPKLLPPRTKKHSSKSFSIR